MAPHADWPADVTALFLIRLRFEAGSSRQMRAEIRMTRDVTAGFQESLTVTDVESAVALLREWLRPPTFPAPPEG